jgi:hypothetical protein
VTLTSSLCWLGTGLWLLADQKRLRRVWALSLQPWQARLLRWLAAALVLVSALPLVSAQGAALASVAALLALMAALSVAVLLFPLRPRWYAASVAGAGLVVLLSLAAR